MQLQLLLRLVLRLVLVLWLLLLVVLVGGEAVSATPGCGIATPSCCCGGGGSGGACGCGACPLMEPCMGASM